MQLQLHGLFYLGFAKHKLRVYSFKIPLKGFRSPSIVDLYAATCFHQFFIINLVPVNACRNKRLEKPHRFHRSNSQDIQKLIKCKYGFLLYIGVLDWNPKCFHRLGLDLKFAKHDFWSVEPIFRSIELHKNWTLLLATYMFLNLDLNHHE